MRNQTSLCRNIHKVLQNSSEFRLYKAGFDLRNGCFHPNQSIKNKLVFEIDWIEIAKTSLVLK